MHSATRAARRWGVGLPTFRPDRRPPGLAAYPLFLGRHAVDVVRGRVATGVNPAGGTFPPANFGAPTPLGCWAASGFYSRWDFPNLPGAATQSAHTVEGLVFAYAAPSANTLTFMNRGIVLGINSGGAFYAQVYDYAVRTATGTTVPTANRLYVVHGVLNAGTLRLYVDGVEEATAVVPGTVSQFGNPLVLSSSAGFVDQSVRIVGGGSANGVAWSPGLIRQRARDPWGFLDWPADLAMAMFGHTRGGSQRRPFIFRH